MKTAVTETGSVYEIDGMWVRRVGQHGMREDGEWTPLLYPVEPVLGQSMVMYIDLGVADVIMTTRQTSTVVAIKEGPAK